MLKKKVASILTTVIRMCPSCGARCTLSPKTITKCTKCGVVVAEQATTDEATTDESTN